MSRSASRRGGRGTAPPHRCGARRAAASAPARAASSRERLVEHQGSVVRRGAHATEPEKVLHLGGVVHPGSCGPPRRSPEISCDSRGCAGWAHAKPVRQRGIAPGMCAMRVVVTARRPESSMVCIAASSALAPAPSMPSSSATSPCRRPRRTPSSGAIRRPVRSSPTSPPTSPSTMSASRLLLGPRPGLRLLLVEPLLQRLAALGVAQVVGLALGRRVPLVQHVLDATVVQGVLGLQLVSTHGSDVRCREPCASRCGASRAQEASSRTVSTRSSSWRIEPPLTT